MPTFLLSLAVYPSICTAKLPFNLYQNTISFPICASKISKVNDIPPGKEQDQVLIVLSMLIWLGRTNQRGDSKKKKPASLGFSRGKQAPDKLCLQSTVWFSRTAICFPMVIEMEQFSSNSLPSLTSLTFMDWPPKFLEAEIQVPLASVQ